MIRCFSLFWLPGVLLLSAACGSDDPASLPAEEGSGDAGFPDANMQEPEPPSVVPVLSGIDLADPAISLPDLSGLVPLAGPYFAGNFRSSETESQLNVVELATCTVRPMAESNRVRVARIPDGTGYIFQDIEREATNNLQFVRLLPNGFVPAQSIAGYADRPAEFGAGYARFADPRFALASTMTDDVGTLDVIDFTAGRVYGSLEGFYPVASAPEGYYFVAGSGDELQPYGWAKLTATGVTPVVHLPKFASAPLLSEDGKQLWYLVSTRLSDGSFLLDLFLATFPFANDAHVPVDLPISFLRAGAGKGFIYAMLRDGTNSLWYRIAADGTREALVPAGHGDFDFAENETLRLITSPAGDFTRVELQIRSQPENLMLLTSRGQPGTTVTERHVAYHGESGETHVLGLEAGSVKDVVIEDFGNPECFQTRGDTAMYRSPKTKQLVFVSLASAEAKVLGSLPIGSTCPALHRTENKLAYYMNGIFHTVEFSSSAVGQPSTWCDFKGVLPAGIEGPLFDG